MLRSITLELNGKVHKIDFVRHIEKGAPTKIEPMLFCPECGTRARMDNDMVNGRVSVDCQQEFGDGKICPFHETHNYLELAKEKILAMEELTKK